MNGGDSGPDTGTKIGRTLELARKERGLSLEQVEEATKIRTGYLRDLERENFGVLPAVYVQGSLRTYANFLQLDAEAMVQELKHRQATQERSSYPLYVGPPQVEDSLDDVLAAAGGMAGTRSRAVTEEDRTKDAVPPLLSGGVSWYLYLGSAVFLILVVAAVAVALNAAEDSRPAVSQVREPLISQAPETSPPDTGEDAHIQLPPQDEKSTGDEKTQPENPAGSKAKDEEPNKDDSGVARSSASATATASASATATASASATATASAAAEQNHEKATSEPSQRSDSNFQASAPARHTGSAPPSNPRPTGLSGGSSPSGDDGQLRVKVVVGAKDPVRLTGGPFDD